MYNLPQCKFTHVNVHAIMGLNSHVAQEQAAISMIDYMHTGASPNEPFESYRWQFSFILFLQSNFFRCN